MDGATVAQLGGAVVGVGALAWLFVSLQRQPLDFVGKHVLVTGGSKGLGLAVAVYAASRGANVTILARDRAGLAAAKQQIEHPSREALAPDSQASRKFPTSRVLELPADVSQRPQVVDAIQKATTQLGPPNIVVLCAGYAFPSLFLETPEQQFRNEIDVNYLGTVWPAQECVRIMLEHKIKGELIFVSSIMATTAFAGYSAYCASKWAVRGLADSLRNELAGSGIRVFHFLPANIDTPGFKTENETKPKLTAEIEGQASMLSPDATAKIMFNNIARGVYASSVDVMGQLMLAVSADACAASVGTSPRQNLLLDMILLPFLAPIFAIVVVIFDRTVKAYFKAHSRFQDDTAPSKRKRDAPATSAS